MKGKRVVWPSKGVALLEDYETGTPEPNEIIVKAKVTRLIGTDVALFYALPNTTPTVPGTVGYERMKQGTYYPFREASGGFAGVVAVVGKDVAGFQVGDRVYADGPHASYFKASEERFMKIPDGVSFEEASFMNYFNVALCGTRKALIELGESVAVFGLGAVGLASVQLARLNGGRPLIGVDVADNRLEIARRTGADYVFNLKKVDVAKEIQNVTSGEGANVVIDATGFPETVPAALQSAAMYGRVIIVGSPRGITKEVDFYRYVHRPNVVIIGAHCRGAYVDTRHDSIKNLGLWTRRDNNALLHRLLAEREIRCEELVKASIKLSHERVQEAYEIFHKQKDRYLCTFLDWTEKEQTSGSKP